MIMKEVKHSFKAMSKRCLLVSDSKLMQHKAMLNEPSEVARFALADRLRDTIDVIGSKTRVAGACGVTEQAVTGWLKTGRIHKKHLPVIAGMAKRDLGWLLTGQEDAPSAPSTAADLATPPPGSRVVAWETLSDLPDASAYVVVPHYDVALSAGSGCCWVEHPDNEPLVFRLRWFVHKGVRPEQCRALYVRGVSMEPTLLDGDTVLIDTARTEVQDDAVFALIFHGDLYIKRLFRLPGGGVEMRSDNPRHPTRSVIDADLASLVILGMMIWRAG